MKFAAIDIGSNAIRLQLTKVLEFENRITFKKLEYIRFPLRLGHDVFSIGKIGSEKEEAFMKLMHAYKNMIDLYEIIHYYGCATSAMRESENGIDIVRRVQEEVGLELNIISGQREAEMINTVISLNLDNQTYIHIDVGGGSTELNFYRNQEKVLSESFNLGSVRRLEKNDSPQVWEAMQKWIQDQLKGNKGRIVAIGTGGNINKLYELSKVKSKRIMSINTLIKMQEYLKGTTLDDRLNRLQLNPDRADVIIPASEIYLSVMRFAGAKSIYVPDIGLKDGINYYLYDKYYPSKGKVLVRNS
ncbi:MAG: exopolyphosphatase/guanosine-5'-triphosphate,3'-diphosphate pyrophosphatase [Cyclobacteriaceae bacterium]